MQMTWGIAGFDSVRAVRDLKINFQEIVDSICKRKNGKIEKIVFYIFDGDYGFVRSQLSI